MTSDPADERCEHMAARIGDNPPRTKRTTAGVAAPTIAGGKVTIGSAYHDEHKAKSCQSRDVRNE